MAEVLSIGVIVFLCTAAITTVLLIILYCVCRSEDPLLDHTCVAWLHSPRTVSKTKYDVLPLYDMQNGHNAPRDDKLGTIERLRVEEKKEKKEKPTRGVDVKRKEFYERYPEKCPLSIDDPNFHRSESSGRGKAVSREKGRDDERRRSHENHSRRSKEQWEPKSKSVHDIYVNEQYYLQSPPQTSRSLNFIDKYDERDGGVASSLYMHPPRHDEKSHHYVRPRSVERNDGGSNHSYLHSLLPRTLEREGRRGRRDKRESQSSSHYVRPRSLEPERKERSHSSHNVRPRSLEKDERDGIKRSHSSHYVRPRSLEKDVKDSHVSSSHYVYPQSLEDKTDSLYVNQPPPAAKEETRHKSKHPTRSKDDILHAKDNYYQNVSAINDDEQFLTKSREETPLLKASEEIAMSEVQQLSSGLPQRNESERQLDRHHQTGYKQEDRDRKRMRDGSERQSRPRSRLTEYRRPRSSHELFDVGWSDHKKGPKDNYFLPRTQSMISARPTKNDDSTIGRRHTIHLEFHPRSGDVTPVDSEKESGNKKNRPSIQQEYSPKEQREFSARRNIKKQDAIRAQQNYADHAQDTKRRQSKDKKSHIKPEVGKNGLTIPPRYDSVTDEYRSTLREDRMRASFTIPPRYDSLPDRYRDAGHEPRPLTTHSRDQNKRFTSRKTTLDEHRKLQSRKSTESTSSRATMESVHKEIESSSIYKKTDDGRLVLRDTSQEPSQYKGTRAPEKMPIKGPVEDTATQRTRTPEKIPIKGPSKDTETQRARTPDTIPREGPAEDTVTQRARVPPKRTKSIERVFYVKSVPRSEPMLNTETPLEVSSDEIVDWNLLKLTGQNIDVSEDERSQDTPYSAGDESNQLIQPNAALPSKGLSDKNIDWHLFSLNGQVEDHKSAVLNNPSQENGPTEPSHEVKQAIVTNHKNIDWHLFTIAGEKIDEKKTPTQDNMSTTSTKDSIKQSLETQIKYGEELHTSRRPKVKPMILHFE
ncbi:uncharacterized protein LOC116293753 [Actinia tenebrosa]|uniref:Uncharacterized protein LOC116293753 n=1 Tax=Actinia tenebrosa TaxID=6105 RepID=A0A6P8HWV1_ACTTE|nr:uncharacterized protein LOC116293753 [Actinia tenebrosa]